MKSAYSKFQWGAPEAGRRPEQSDRRSPSRNCKRPTLAGGSGEGCLARAPTTICRVLFRLLVPDTRRYRAALITLFGTRLSELGPFSARARRLSVERLLMSGW